MTKQVWAIWSYTVALCGSGGFVDASVGKPYAELRRLARQMSSNGEGQRYEVRRYTARTTKA